MRRSQRALSRRQLLGGAVFASFLAASLGGQPRNKMVDRRRGLGRVEQWNDRLKKIDQLLVEGESQKAYRQSTAIYKEMTQSIVAGEGVAGLLALTLTLRAIAAVEIGKEDEGIWHWQVAQQLFPDVSGYALSAYGDTGPFLKSHPPRTLETTPKEQILDGDTEKPVKRAAPLPEFPRARLGVPRKVIVVVNTIIEVDGRLRQPLVLNSAGELTMICATFEALRRWRFEPATRKGEAVPVAFTLTVNFGS